MKKTSFLMLSLAFLTLLPGKGFSHFVYVLPNAERGDAMVVFSDYLKPDEKVDIRKIESTKLIQVKRSGATSPLKWELEEHSLHVNPISSPSVIWGETDYGVSSGRHSGNVPNRLFYYPKTVLGDFSKLPAEVLSAGAVLTIQPLSSGDSFRFQVLYQGNSLSGAECHVLSPGYEKSIPVTTDANGIGTIPLDASGLYGIRVKVTEDVEGHLKEVEFKKINHWATLVLNLQVP